MDASEYDALEPAAIEAAVAAGTLTAAEALVFERGRITPRPEVIEALGGASSPVDGPQASGTVAGPTSPAHLATQHGTQDEPRGYLDAEAVGTGGATGTEDEPRVYRESAPQVRDR